MEDLIFYDRLQFAFTITFHYIFPQLTMGLSLIIVYFKWQYIRKNVERYNDAAKFFMKIFAINFTMGVVTGIPIWGKTPSIITNNPTLHFAHKSGVILSFSRETVFQYTSISDQPLSNNPRA